MEKNLDITKPCYSEQKVPIPWPFVISRFHCIMYFIVTDDKKTVEQQVEWKNISACVVLLIGAIMSPVFRLIVECTSN